VRCKGLSLEKNGRIGKLLVSAAGLIRVTKKLGGRHSHVLSGGVRGKKKVVGCPRKKGRGTQECYEGASRGWRRVTRWGGRGVED